MFKFKTKPQSITEIAVSGFTLYWKSLRKVWFWSFLLAIITSIPDWVMSHLIEQRYSVPVLLTADLFFILMIPLGTFCIAVILYHLYLTGSQTQKKFSEITSLIKERLLWMSLAVLLVMMATWLGVFLFIIPGIFIAVMLIFVLPLMLLDDLSLVDAFKTSWNLVRGNWWHTFGALIIPLILFYIAVPSIYSGNPSLTHLILDLIRMVLVTPLFFAYILTLFYDSKLRHHVPLHLPKGKKQKLSDDAAT